LKLINSFKDDNVFQENIYYKFNNQNFTKKSKLYINFLLDYAFKGLSCLISKPVYMETPDKIIIKLFFYLMPNTYEKNKQMLRRKLINLKYPRIKSIAGINIPNDNNMFELASLKAKQKNFNKKFIGNAYAKKGMLTFFTTKNVLILKKLSTILSKIFQKSIELDLTRLQRPYFDDNILMKLLGLLSKQKKYSTSAKYMLQALFSRTKFYALKPDKFKIDI
jgi:hypothetical protein